MQHGHGLQHGHGHTAWIWTCSMEGMERQYGHYLVAWTWTCTSDMDMEMQYEQGQVL
jgi:hypothetical protein